MADPEAPADFTAAMNYVKELQAKETFQSLMLRLLKEHRPDLWPQFQEYITEYRTPPRNLDRFHTQVKELLKDEPDLYVRFEEFFPKKSGGQETEGQGESNAT
ncbi:hypothetical protein VE02_09359 [Pseudogymnoascus sp. 03VT05]|nr:hypothetical protein VE02_09359 [Pseudogymnoascus sp. 03VT05]